MRAIVMTVDPDAFVIGEFIKERFERCIASLHTFRMPYEVYYGPTRRSDCHKLADKLNIETYKDASIRDKNLGCMLSHSWAFNRVIQLDEPHVILEFDAYMIKAIDFEIEEDKLYRLHPEELGHGHIVTPTVAHWLLESARNKTWDRWREPYDNLMNIMDNRIDMPDYVAGNEENNKKLSTRFATKT